MPLRTTPGERRALTLIALATALTFLLLATCA
jgi:hypothetical protein